MSNVRISPAFVAISQRTDLGPYQQLLLGTYQAMEEFFDNSGCPLNASQRSALEDARAAVLSGVDSVTTGGVAA